MQIKYLTYLKSVLFSVLFLTLPFALMEQFIFQEASSTEDKIIFGCVGIILGLIETFLLLIILGHGIKKYSDPNTINLGKYYKKHLRDLIIETFRGMGRIAVGFLLIWPGIKRCIQYYLIPYIVQFDSDYQEGKVDVLEESALLLEGRLSRFAAILCLTQMVMLGIQIASVNFNLFTTPVAWILFYILEVTLQVCVFLMFYKYYLALSNARCGEH
ncbi:MAG: hypothetical protein V4596_03905 [Bdellovibrionota bacterium]